ncbi:hypothetical protein QUF99_08850 [Bacillus sp. DX4.1]|uniref:hypothetical protein n=1 Tax=Bacillus sp. DX4.1 TaxID=3055867 RepID=UPI0025A2A434|nr:hypothetical protein [Bacillus sp. DX4.1]MDM5187424.1 hypothetical protein [Bacillus sp. DX4.1]
MEHTKKRTVIEFFVMIAMFGVIQMIVRGRPDQQVEWLHFATECFVFTIGLGFVALFTHKVKL